MSETVDAFGIAARLSPSERDIFPLLVKACDEKDASMCDGVVCMHFVRKRMMGLAPDGFVITPLGREIVAILQEARPSKTDG